MTRVRAIYVLGALMATLCLQAVAGDLFSDFKKAAGDVTNAIVKTTTAPTTVVVNAAQAAVGQKSPDEIFDPYRKAASSVGDAVSSTSNMAQNPQNFLYEKAEEFVQKTSGDPGSFVFDVATFNYQLNNKLAASGAQASANVLRGENPLEVTAAPLAAAIHAAREKFISSARPLPQDMINALRGQFDDTTLQRARYSIGNVQITLPSIIGQGNRMMGQDYAVTVDDVIVFNTNPPPFASNPIWWTHELTHIQQYSRWGVERFAWEYARDFGHSVENEAVENSYAVVGRLQNGNQFASLNTGTSGFTPGTAVQEYFVAQCIFMDLAQNPQNTIQVLVTNTGKVIAMDARTGQWFQVAWAAPPRGQQFAWTYQMQSEAYDVMPNGAIWTPAFGGRQIGYVTQLASVR
jgi:hypothetical protein